MDEIYILQSCNEWKEHSSANIEAVSTDICMIYVAVYEKLLAGDMQYKHDTLEESVIAFREDVVAGEIDYSLLNYGMIRAFDNMQITNPLLFDKQPNIENLYAELFGDLGNVDCDVDSQDFER